MKNQLKYYTITGFLFVSVLGTLSHFFYQWSGKNPIVGLFTPVNESVPEHMKLLFSPAVLYLILTGHKWKKRYPGLVCGMILGILTGTCLIPVIFYTYTRILGHHMLFLDIALFYFSVAVTFFIAYKFAGTKKILR